MKRWFIDTAFLILEFIGLLIMGCIVFPLIGIIGFFYSMIKHFIKLDYSAKKHTKPLFRALSLASDCAANACGGEMLNDLSKAKDNEIRYGNWNQTISSVTGLRFIFNKRDSRMRRFLNKLQKNHCDDAPTDMELFYYKNK